MRVRRCAVGSILTAAVLIAPSLTHAEASGQPEGGANSVLRVTKVVTGDPDGGTRFTVNAVCEGDQGTDFKTYDFDAAGGTQDQTTQLNVTRCAVTETNDGGAESVTYAAGAPASGCDVTIGPGSAQVDLNQSTCEVIITNGFPEAQPAGVDRPPLAAPAPAVVTPSFTG